jgi:hypothetical protein
VGKSLGLMDEAAVGCDASVHVFAPFALATGIHKPADQVVEVRVNCVTEIGVHGRQEGVPYWKKRIAR